jgi:GNAT superfamily N-acetyltransferase
MSLIIRSAQPSDAAAIVGFVRALAVYERLEHEVVATPEDFAAALFCKHPKVFCEIALRDGAPVGIALWFYSFSTFLGRHGIFLEDLFVAPEARGVGAGKALLATLARRCITEGLPRFEWQVLDWNQPAIDFYAAQGADVMDGWKPVRLTGDALAKLAETAP